MKILMCISHVPDTITKIKFNSEMSEFDKNGVQFIINPNDEFGLTKAIRIKEKNNAEISVINVGLSDTEPTLRKALAIGADKAYRINCNPENPNIVANKISDFCKDKNFDIIMCGKESIDYNGGIVPGLIASKLNYNFVNLCTNLELQENEVLLKSESDEGIINIKSKTPIVIGAQKGLVEEKDLIIPNMRGILTARSKTLEVIETEKLDCGYLSKSYETPKPKSECRFFEKEEITSLIEEIKNNITI